MNEISGWLAGDLSDVPTVGLVFSYTFNTFSILTLVAFTVERMLMVFQPFSNHVKNWLKLKIYLVIFCLLLLSIFLYIPLMRQVPIIFYCPETGTIVWEWDYLWLYSLCQMVVATIIILPCNIALVIKLKKEGYFKKFGKQIMDEKKIHIGCLPTLKLADFRITLVSIGISLFFIIAILPMTLFLLLVSFSEVFPNFPFDKQSEPQDAHSKKLSR